MYHTRSVTSLATGTTATVYTKRDPACSAEHGFLPKPELDTGTGETHKKATCWQLLTARRATGADMG